MGKANFSDEFKRYAVAPNTEQGHTAVEVSQQLGVNLHRPYAKRQHAKVVSGPASKDA